MRGTLNMLRVGFVVTTAVVLLGCSSHEVRQAHTVSLATSGETIPENRLLDVAILEFDPGFEDEEEALEDGIFPQVRRAEARYLSVHLRDTLQQSGHWGAVRVTPLLAAGSDLVLTGRIEESDGDRVELAVEAIDADGRVWLDKS